MMVIISLVAFGTTLGWLFGSGLSGGLVIGMLLSVTSTSTIEKSPDKTELSGFLFIHELLPGVISASIPLLSQTSHIRIILFFFRTILLVTFCWIIKCLLAFFLKQTNSNQNPLMPLCFAALVSLLTEKIELSFELGAFIAGLLMAKAPFSEPLESCLKSFSFLTEALLYGSIGLSLDIGFFNDNIGIMLAFFAFVNFVKLLLTTFLLIRITNSLSKGFSYAFQFAGVGEFAIVLGLKAVRFQLLSVTTAHIITSTCMFPLLFLPLEKPIRPILMRSEKLFLKSRDIEMN
eukprot:GHVP01011835.1.p1 GENE.GHVP01011835.1~~GHVP01011835.1.p1  ORF type:complete len:290 (-),score=35.40 GHVP01011835.1:80-949(-)